MMRTPATWRRGLTARPSRGDRRARPADARRPGAGAWLGSARLALGTASALGLARFAYGLLVPPSLAHLRVVTRLWRVATAYLLFAAGYIAYITFLSAYLTAHHASTVQVAVTWAALGIAGMAAPALWSRPVRTWPGATALAASLAGLSASAAVPLISAAPVVVAASAVGYGATFLVVPAAVTSLVHSAVPRPDWTGALAAFTVVFATGQMAGPYLAGGLADRYGTGATLVWTAALCAAGAGLGLAVRTVPGPAE
jgi:predicted MFS family arabinose efflux permease